MGKYDELPGFQQGLEEIVREGARKMLHQAKAIQQFKR